MKLFIAKFSSMEIQEIKQRLPIEKVMQHYGLKPDKNHRLCCPFHKDKTPSMQVYPKTNTWTCFSSNCTAGSGDQIDFIMKKEGINKHEAILKAQDLLGLPSETKPKTKPIKPEPMQQRTEILTESFQHFARSMNAKPEKAIKYLESRKLDYKKLNIGYDAG
ncbi:MAG: CHC2 zinc finger domain-containing protein, partial [Bacteroidales bacterium]|nr:CHC2 zinc finger domain-containing protein [Bacteroidales bacterium]